MEEEKLGILEQCALFRGLDRKQIAECLQKCAPFEQIFSQVDEIVTRRNGAVCLGFLLSGTLTVYAAGEALTPLNHLREGSVFGVSALFGSPGANTHIHGESAGVVLLIDEARAEILWEDRIIRKNLISFLTNRICFLNRKIASFTAKGAEGKLARHLSQCADANGCCTVESYSLLAKELHLGRASLYRAMDKLEEEGFLHREKKVIRLLCPESASQSL